MIFASRLTGAGVTTGADSGIWTDANGSLELLAREGDHAPGTPAGARFGDLGGITQPLINDSGQVLLYDFPLQIGPGGVTAGNASAIWLGITGNLSLIARLGDQVPGLPSGVTFFDFEQLCGFNSAGAFAFHARVDGPGIDFTNERAVFVFDPEEGALRKVARKGDLVQSTSGLVPISQLLCGNYNLREISSVGGGQQRHMNAAGRFAFSATSFTAQTDSFLFLGAPLISLPVSVPLPLWAYAVTGLLLVLAGVAVARRRLAR